MGDATAVRAPAARPAWIGLGVLLVGELVALMLRFDTGTLRRSGQAWWADTLWDVKIVLPPLAIAIVTAAILIGGDRLRDELRRASPERARSLWPFLLAHLAAFALFARLTFVILEGSFATATLQWPWIAAWFAAAVTTLILWVLCVWPPRLLAAVARRTAPILIAGCGVGGVAWAAGLWTETWWEPLRASTITAVSTLVHLVAADVFVDAPNLVVGTSRFSVRIVDACAGYEGIGLIWVFLGVYLWMFRRTLRFPRALLLLPIGTAAIWLANALRLTALIALGTWVSPDVALGGFHVYSGSLLFAAVALALASAAGRSRFFSLSASADRTDPERVAAGRTHAGAVVYVLPLLVIIATSMVTGALSPGGFDGGYPLRVVAALVTLWILRRGYRALSCTWSWGTVTYGVVAFALWMALEPAPAASSHGIGTALAALPPAAAGLWLVFRVLGSVVTVPIAEELAFRGYLARRLVTADFARLSPRHVSCLAFVGSSVLFGAMHSRLIAGTLTGALYLLCYRRRGELADAILAHAITNALIAAYVLTTGTWALWA